MLKNLGCGGLLLVILFFGCILMVAGIGGLLADIILLAVFDYFSVFSDPKQVESAALIGGVIVWIVSAIYLAYRLNKSSAKTSSGGDLTALFDILRIFD